MKENGKFYDANGNETNYASVDLTKGGFFPHTETIHHDEDPGENEVSKYVLDRTYPNGGRDYHREIITPGRPPMPAYDEEVTYYVYREFTEEELAERAKNAEISEINAELEATKDKVIAHLEGLITDEEYAVVAARRMELRARLAELQS